MESDWLLCDRCPCGYSNDIRREGERCDDLSWVPSVVYQRRYVTSRMARRLGCKGRVWPVPSKHRHWDAERLRDWRQAAINAVIGGK